MIEILPAPDHVAAYRLERRLTADDYDGMIADIEGRLAATSTSPSIGRLGFTDMPPEALAWASEPLTD